MKQILLFLISLNIFCTNSKFSGDTESTNLKSGFFEVVQKWSQEPNGYSRKVFVKVPENKLEKYPCFSSPKFIIFPLNFNFLEDIKLT